MSQGSQAQSTTISVKLYADIVQVKLGTSVETLHLNVVISRITQKQTGRQVLLPTAFGQPLTVDSDHAKVITNAIECLTLWICDCT